MKMKYNCSIYLDDKLIDSTSANNLTCLCKEYRNHKRLKDIIFVINNIKLDAYKLLHINNVGSMELAKIIQMEEMKI